LSLRRSSFAVIELVGIILLTLLVPAGIRLLPGVHDSPRRAYLPSLEGAREHPFHAHRIPELQRLKPDYVVIGDSMAGTRINERLLGGLIGRPVAPLLQAGSGPAFWYLAMKNWVIASGIRPRVVSIFFRDTNLTDTMFRLDPAFGWSLDSVATDALEAELDAAIAATARGSWFRAHDAVERTYRATAARGALEPALVRAPAEWITASRRRQTALLEQVNARFGLDHLRPMEAADIAQDAGVDFHDVVERSPLPLMLRDASRAGFLLCLVRVQRRPVDGKPPHQSPALQRYVSDLRSYVEARGAFLLDDTGDPAQTLDMYEDGDHIARGARDRYTTMFWERLRPILDRAELTR
jgi:hypothetical protein